MRRAKRIVVVLLIVLAFAALLLLLTRNVQAIQDVAEGLPMRSLGTFGLVVTGLLAPIVYVIQRITRFLFGDIFGSLAKEKELAARNEELKKQIARIEGEVKRLDDERTRELGEALERIGRIEREIEGAKAKVASTDKAIDSKIAEVLHPRPSEMSTEELLEWYRLHNIVELPAPSNGGR